MQHKILTVENKNNDWKVVSIAMPDDNTLQNVSVNRANKKGEVFPNFDGVIPNALIDGELWESGASKWYLFAPKQKPQRAPSAAPAQIAKAQEVKRENIEEAQNRKQDAIQKAGAFRDATLVSLAAMRDVPFPTDAEYQQEWRKWVKFFLGAADEPFI